MVNFIATVLAISVFVALVVITVVLVRHSSKIQTLKEKHDTLEDQLMTQKDTYDMMIKNLVDSVNYNDKVASIDNHKMQHYMSNALRDSNEKMKVLDSSINTVQTVTNSNLKTIDDNLKYNISKLYSDTNDLDTKYTHMAIDTAQKFIAGDQRVNRLENTKMDCEDFMVFKNSDFEEHRKNLAETTQDIQRMSTTNQ